MTHAAGDFLKYSFDPAEIEVGEDRLLPLLFSSGSGMKRFVEPIDHALRAGFTKVAAGGGFETFFWYKEIWFVIEGRGVLSVVDKRRGTANEVELRGRDAVYFPEGMRISLSSVGPDDLVFLYCAVPASKRDATWLAAMEPQDLEDVRIRGEFPSSRAKETRSRTGPRVEGD